MVVFIHGSASAELSTSSRMILAFYHYYSRTSTQEHRCGGHMSFRAKIRVIMISAMQTLNWAASPHWLNADTGSSKSTGCELALLCNSHSSARPRISE